MSPRKLSNDDRQEILQLYRTTPETTSTLAIRFGVSSSTISRFLKTNLSTLEYEDLIQEKRLARTPGYHGDYESDFSEDKEDGDYAQLESTSTVISDQNQQQEKQDQKEENSEFESNIDTIKVDDKDLNQLDLFISETVKNKDQEISPEEIAINSSPENNNLFADDEQNITFTEVEKDQTPKIDFELDTEENEDNQQSETIFEQKPLKESENEQLSSQNLSLNHDELITKEESYEELVQELESVNTIQAMFGEDIDEDDDWDDDEDDDEDEDDSFIDDKLLLSFPDEIKVLPLSQAVFPRKCYLAIDRSSELITRPLREFRDLGSIPAEENQQKTLPIFDNHRVAKRYCDRRGKVIKLPNGNIVQKTSGYLQAKGITRLLINGKIYSLK